jgi:hypothetical protein
MPNDAIELILNKWKSIDKEKYSGIVALDANIDGKILIYINKIL